MKYIILTLMLLGGCVATPQSGKPESSTKAMQVAMSVCGIHASMVEALHDRHGEKQAWVALLDNGLMMEMHVSPAGTFTIFLVDGRGMACYYGSGHNYHPLGF